MMKVLFFCILLFPVVTFAQVYDVESTGEYVMGDSDTKVEARKIAFDQAKRLAIEKIGTYLESTTEIQNGQLSKDEITTYTSAIVKAVMQSENVRLLDDRAMVISLTIKASVDIGELNNKIIEIGNHMDQKKRLISLQDENVKLAKELELVSAQLKNREASEISNLRKQREVLFDKLDKNQNTLTLAFERGTLYKLALINKDSLTEEKSNIDDFIQFMINNIKVKIGEPQIRNNGKVSDLIFDVNWTLIEDSEHHSIFDIIKNYPLLDDEARTQNDIYSGGGRDGNAEGWEPRFVGVNGAKLEEYIKYKSVIMQIKVGDRTANIKIMPKGSRMFTYKDNTTIVMSNIPTKQLEKISNITAEFITDDLHKEDIAR
jgi:hypothetical protein